VKPLYLIDKSALARMSLESVRRRLAPILEAGEAATCAIIDLEMLYSARSRDDYEDIRRRRSLAYHTVPIAQTTLQRALAVQAALARIGHHRVAIPDLMIAAAAEAAGLTVLHYDRDYDVIARVTGQPVEWVVERGSVP
jgi:predicted nucleic acid-binding protein